MDIAVWGALSDVEIVALDHNNKESDEEESEELTPVSLSEAKVSLNKLLNFFLQNHVDADILQASFVLEKSIDKTSGHSKRTDRRRYKEPKPIKKPITAPVIGSADWIFADLGKAGV
ncbi:hypothetical protein TNCV_79991 [Trichonephila clavipes]|nr:hypothetical protein TNCV_79991 [Trichonephila clavipes]